MKNFFKAISFLIFIFPVSGVAQYYPDIQVISANTTDTGGNVWANSTFTFTLNNPQGQIPVYTRTGLPVTTNVIAYADSTGSVTANVAQNSEIQPAGTCWNITVNPNASTGAYKVGCLQFNTPTIATYNLFAKNLSGKLSPPSFPFVNSTGIYWGYGDGELTGNPTAGTIFFNVQLNTCSIWNSTSWVGCGVGSGISSIAAGSGISVTGTTFAKTITCVTATNTVPGCTTITTPPAAGNPGQFQINSAGVLGAFGMWDSSNFDIYISDVIPGGNLNYNVSLGRGAFAGTNVGNKNVAVGFNALQGNNYGGTTDSCVAIGFQAGSSINNCWQSVFLGYNSMIDENGVGNSVIIGPNYTLPYGTISNYIGIGPQNATSADYYGGAGMKIHGSPEITGPIVADAGCSGCYTPPPFTGTSGYQLLPSGLILEWGTLSGIADDAASSGSLPFTFPHACFSATASEDESVTAARSGNPRTIAATCNTTSIILWASGSGSSGKWQAIGW